MKNELDEWLDAEINRVLKGDGDLTARATSAEEQLARAWLQLAAEESSQLTPAAWNRGLAALQTRAAAKQRVRVPRLAFLNAVPRWLQIAAVALIVVVLANGITQATAESLPGSILYPIKRVSEHGELLLQNTSAERARVWMTFANRRLDEIQNLLVNGHRVEPTVFDAVDESILRALSEIASTRGSERVALLQELTALAARQQHTIQALAQSASPPDRARLEQTSKFLKGVVTFVESGEIERLPSVTPSLTPTPPATPRATPVPSNTPRAEASPTFAESDAIAPALSSPVPVPTDREPLPTDAPTPTHTPQPAPTLDPTHAPTNTAQPNPTHAPTNTHEPDPTETHEPTHEPAPTDTHQPTHEPEPTETHEPTHEPEPSATREPTATRARTHEPTHTKEPTEHPTPHP